MWPVLMIMSISVKMKRNNQTHDRNQLPPRFQKMQKRQPWEQTLKMKNVEKRNRRFLQMCCTIHQLLFSHNLPTQSATSIYALLLNRKNFVQQTKINHHHVGSTSHLHPTPWPCSSPSSQASSTESTIDWHSRWCYADFQHQHSTPSWAGTSHRHSRSTPTCSRPPSLPLLPQSKDGMASHPAVCANY